MCDPALELHKAFVSGDLESLRRSLGNPTDFPHTRFECDTSCLIYALYHSPLSLVRQLLELGANPNEVVQDGFPTLFAALDSNHADQIERIALLLEFGADVQQRGVNDYTILHYAACRDNAAAVNLLLSRGANPQARTRIDHYGTALEEAERFGHPIGAAALRYANRHS